MKLNKLKENNTIIFISIKNFNDHQSLKTKIGFFLFFFILFNSTNFILGEKEITAKTQNKIILKIDGRGYQKVIGSNSFPDLVYLNGLKTKINNEGKIFIINSNENNEVTMIWNHKVFNLEDLFIDCENILEIDFSNFDSSGVTNMNGMFFRCKKLNFINFNNINTSSVIDMAFMFQECESLITLNLSSFDTSKVIDMEYMFYGCLSLYLLDIKNFDTSKVKNMEYMLFGLNKLENIDLSYINTSNVENMDYLFSYDSSIHTLNLSSFDTSNVRTMEGMFMYCTSLISLNLSNFDTYKVTNMKYMFLGNSLSKSLDLTNLNTSNVQQMSSMFSMCNSLKIVNLSKFETKNTYDMSSMFSYCNSLISLDLSNFSFEQVDVSSFCYECKSLISIQFSKDYKLLNKVDFMFYGCSSLTSLDLFNFDFGIVENMRYMFYGCALLTSLELTFINTFQVNNMEYMFYGCNSLKELNFSNWITSSVKSLKSMFYDCISLISLDLSSFDTSFVNDMKDIFFNCISLTSINLKNFDTSKVTDMQSMFYGCFSLLSLDLSSFNTSLVNNMKGMFYNCNKLSSIDLSNFNTNNVENIASIFSGCKNLAYINFYKFSEKSMLFLHDIFSEVPNNLIFCINDKNIDSNTQLLSELSKLKCAIIDCSDNWRGNKKRIIFDTETCVNNCNNDKIYKYEYNYFCYDKCPKGTHPLKNNKYICEKNIVECLKKYYFINLNDNSCLLDCKSIEFFNDICTLNNNNIQSKYKLFENIIEGIEDESMNKLLEKIINEEREDTIKMEENILFQITSSYNQNNKDYKNISSIKLGKCENILKKKYNISENDALIIFKIEEKKEGLLIPLIEYEIFNPKTKEKLNLDFCKNENINIHIPFNINKNNLFKYEPNNKFYNDICNNYITEKGIDITLYDRKEDYIKNNMFICPNNCLYIEYDFNNNKSICQCKIQQKISLFLEISEDININNVKNKKSITNFKVLKKIKLLFTKEGFIKNIGNYIIIPIIFLHLISTIYFFLKGYNLLYKEIEDIINIKKLENNISIKRIKKGEKLKETDYFSSSKKIINNFNHIYSENKLNIESDITKDIFNNKHIIINKELESEIKIIYKEYEINNFSFEEALKNDKRTYFQFYLSLLKYKHILIFTFNINK